jgi:uncharacterized protein involved in type VI secretion and phage assembly
MFTQRDRDTAATFPGLYAGTVERVEDRGRIQVSIPAIFAQTKPENFVWARPCFPYGHYFVPEVNDKVWLAFENGDPTAPVWLGIWYPEGTVPEEADVSPPVKRVIRSSRGSLIIIDDTEDNEQVILADKTGNRIELRTDGVLIKCVTNLTIDASGKEIVIKASSVDVQKA